MSRRRIKSQDHCSPRCCSGFAGPGPLARQFRSDIPNQLSLQKGLSVGSVKMRSICGCFFHKARYAALQIATKRCSRSGDSRRQLHVVAATLQLYVPAGSEPFEAQPDGEFALGACRRQLRDSSRPPSTVKGEPRQARKSGQESLGAIGHSREEGKQEHSMWMNDG